LRYFSALAERQILAQENQRSASSPRVAFIPSPVLPVGGKYGGAQLKLGEPLVVFGSPVQ
jgi:hypothetical protein